MGKTNGITLEGMTDNQRKLLAMLVWGSTKEEIQEAFTWKASTFAVKVSNLRRFGWQPKAEQIEGLKIYRV